MSKIPKKLNVDPTCYDWMRTLAQQKNISMRLASRQVAEEHKELHMKIMELRNREREQASMQIHVDMNLGQKKLKRFRI